RAVWGVDLKHFRRVESEALRATLGLHRDQPVILSPKILQPFYNVHLVVEAMLRILAACPEATLLVTEYAADPKYRRQMAERVEKIGLEKRVRFVGHVPHREMPSYYSLADV